MEAQAEQMGLNPDKYPLDDKWDEAQGRHLPGREPGCSGQPGV